MWYEVKSKLLWHHQDVLPAIKFTSLFTLWLFDRATAALNIALTLSKAFISIDKWSITKVYPQQVKTDPRGPYYLVWHHHQTTATLNVQQRTSFSHCLIPSVSYITKSWHSKDAKRAAKTNSAPLWNSDATQQGAWRRANPRSISAGHEMIMEGQHNVNPKACALLSLRQQSRRKNKRRWESRAGGIVVFQLVEMAHGNPSIRCDTYGLDLPPVSADKIDNIIACMIRLHPYKHAPRVILP